MQVSELCLGCMMFGGRTNLEDSCTIIDRSIEAGMNFIDTANIYNAGESEIVTGEALKRNGKRDNIVLATKVHLRMDENDPNGWGSSRRHIVTQCEASLKRLNTDRIDLYQVHRPHPEVPIDETLQALDDLIRAGKVLYIGSSTFGAWQCVESLWIAKELRLNRFICEQPPYNILDRRIERELLPMAQTYGYGIIPWSPLAGGLLTGKYRGEGHIGPGESRYNDTVGRPWMDDRKTVEAFEAIEKLIVLANEKGVPLSQIALAWVLQNPAISSAIIGPRTLEQLEDNLKAVEIQLTEEENKWIDRIVSPGRMVSPFYEANFGPNARIW